MKKVAIIGAESTGKTTLCKQLAEHFQTKWEPELAREYVERLDRIYRYEDVVKIARTQIKQEQEYENEALKEGLVFFDTDLIVTKVWFQHKYNFVPKFVEEHLQKCFFDFYILCQPDIEWQYDPVRENSNNRQYLHNWYKKEVKKLGTPFAQIGGIGVQRLNNAIEVIDKQMFI